MLIIRGVNVYPTQIETVLNAFPELSPHYRLVVTREGTLDDLEVQSEVAGSASISDTALAERVASMIKGTVGCTARVTLVPPGEAPRSEGGKLARVEDLREL
jgi:phenylacetate-CoA ligase